MSKADKLLELAERYSRLWGSNQMIVTEQGEYLAKKAVHNAKRAYNQMLGVCGGDGRKFRYRIGQLMDELKVMGFEAKLMVEAIRLHLVECMKKGRSSAMKEWN